MATPAQTIVTVPEDQNMAEEPALTIGGIFADKAMIKTIVTAVATLLAGILKVTVIDDETADAIVTLITFIGLVATPIMAQIEARSRAKQQAATTREAVYSPAAAAVIAQLAPNAVAVDPGKPADAVIPDAPPPGRWG